MKCQTCNIEMDWGNIYLKGSPLDFLTGYKKRHLFFSSFNADTNPIKLIEWGQNRRGFYCDSCKSFCLSSKDLSNLCMNCGQTMLIGEYQINKSKIGRFLRNSLNHLYFSQLGKKDVFKVLDGDKYVRGFYCEKCNTLYFEIENR